MRPYLFYCGDLYNLGDLALLLQNLEHVAPGRRAYVRRWAPLPAAIEAQVAAAGGALVDGRRPLAFLRLARQCDVVIGGGQLVRGNVSLPSLIAQYAGVAAARLGGGSVSTRGLGVSAIRDRPRRILWRALLRLADKVRVRDSYSVELAAVLVGRERVVQTADMAFLPGCLHRAAQPDTARDRIVIAPCIDGSEGRAMTAATLAPLLAAARGHRAGDRVVFVCHDPRPSMDAAATQRLIGALDLPCARIVDGDSLAALLAEYRRAALVITNRLHAMIFALLADCPIVVVDDGNAKTRFVADHFSLPVVGGDDGDAIADATTRALVYRPGGRAAALDAMARRAAANLD